MIDLLAKPILDLADTLGTGVLPGGGPADALRSASATVERVHDSGRRAVAAVHGEWNGTAATAALVRTEEAQRSATAIADRGEEMAAIVAEAAECIRAGTEELRAIAQSFVQVATAALPALATPAGLGVLVSLALEHLSRASAVVARVRSELDGYTAAMRACTPVAVPEPPGGAATTSAAAATGVATTTAAAAPASPLSAATTTAASALGGSGTSGISGLFAPSDSRVSPAAAAVGAAPGSAATGTSGAADRGEGVRVVLPDGTTAIAPNQAAADAVRNALSQQGVPYVWGGTTPGQGLDCSGLTQWAYGEAGVGLPRLAQEQNVGIPVDSNELMAGDLAVWDGHVAMVIGNGQLVEAGDPVSVGPIRTTNSGMAFMGFYRPTT
ncbi:hydrolase [Rhodococcus rhodnii]|uniref:NlpC/P60 domain-containing protein n=2 Tax=Rhodococcus rhodnii TaxID=38312 RepID=R7WJJ1_9NOCA|nr:C40 family peptidase [Rhodococcus rhodnii]EOM75440.1 hypothetical protein Rrhod_3238 [Rhodococcus rhodnii LMG 5362]TXG90533.1 hydrolase [Rhodococcus rhodnii]